MGYNTTTLSPGAGGDKVLHDTLATIDGAAAPASAVVQGVKLLFGAAGDGKGVSPAQPLPVRLQGTDRTFIQLWASGAAAGATGVETAITLTRSGAPGAATTTGTSFTVTNGKRFRITSITFASRGNATATAQVTTFALRVNSAGAVVTTSAIALAARTATPSTALAWDRFTVPLESEGIELVGDGTLAFGVTANSVFTTNAPTWDVVITGYEY